MPLVRRQWPAGRRRRTTPARVPGDRSGEAIVPCASPIMSPRRRVPKTTDSIRPWPEKFPFWKAPPVRRGNGRAPAMNGVPKINSFIAARHQFLAIRCERHRPNHIAGHFQCGDGKWRWATFQILTVPSMAAAGQPTAIRRKRACRSRSFMAGQGGQLLPAAQIPKVTPLEAAQIRFPGLGRNASNVCRARPKLPF